MTSASAVETQAVRLPVDVRGDAPDRRLLDRIRVRDDAALVALIERHAGAVVEIARRVLGDCALLSEVVQHLFLTVWDDAGAFSTPHTTVETKLLQAAYARASEARTCSAVQAELELAEYRLLGLWPPHETVTAVFRAHGDSLLASVPAASGRLLRCVYVDGLTHAEVAVLVGESLGTIKHRLVNALGHARSVSRGVPR